MNKLERSLEPSVLPRIHIIRHAFLVDHIISPIKGVFSDRTSWLPVSNI
jgi:hypothetical protein